VSLLWFALERGIRWLAYLFWQCASSILKVSARVIGLMEMGGGVEREKR